MQLKKLLPAKLRKKIKSKLLNSINFSSFPVSYSQKGEDFILRGIFDCLDIARPSYIDIGANNPFGLNNTAFFYTRGSRGVNIEPNPVLLENIANIRKEDINIMAGVGTSTGTMPFYVMNADVMSTFSKSVADEYCEKHGFKLVDVIQVKVDTLKNIINDYCGGVFPDFMSLDTEGLDEMILATLKDCPTLPKVICTEAWEYMGKNHISEICEILEPLGYMLFLDNHLNSIFVLKDLWEEALNNRRAKLE